MNAVGINPGYNEETAGEHVYRLSMIDLFLLKERTLLRAELPTYTRAGCFNGITCLWCTDHPVHIEMYPLYDTPALHA